jgi:hypothetical protein
VQEVEVDGVHAERMTAAIDLTVDEAGAEAVLSFGDIAPLAAACLDVGALREREMRTRAPRCRWRVQKPTFGGDEQLLARVRLEDDAQRLSHGALAAPPAVDARRVDDVDTAPDPLQQALAIPRIHGVGWIPEVGAQADGRKTEAVENGLRIGPRRRKAGPVRARALRCSKPPNQAHPVDLQDRRAAVNH